MKKISESSFFAVVIAFCLALVAFWAIDPEYRTTRDETGKPTLSHELVLRQLPVKQVLNEAVAPIQAGEELKVRTKIIRERSCPSRVERIIVDGANFRFVLPDIDFARAPGKMGPDEFTQGIPTHPSSAPGPALLTMLVTWYCNPMDKVIPRSIAIDVPFIIKARS